MTEQELCAAMADYGDTVYRLALCRLQNTADAEDVYQDVFLRLWKQETAEWDAAHCKAWLIRTTLNRCADLHRFRLRRQVVSLESLPEPVAPADESRRLWAAVANLPEKLRVVVHLHYAEGYRTEEIAAMLGCPAATVRTRLARARKKLREGGFDNGESL